MIMVTMHMIEHLKKRLNTIEKLINDGFDFYKYSTTKANHTKFNTILDNGLNIIDNSVLKYRITMENRYGGLHPNTGGYSPLRKVRIKGVDYNIQGYEDVEIYKLIYEQHIDPHDIIALNCKNLVSIPYEFEGKMHMYHPDIYITSLDCYIEVKSIFWFQKEYDKNLAKLRYATNSGYKIILSIYTEDDKKDVRRIRKLIERNQ